MSTYYYRYCKTHGELCPAYSVSGRSGRPGRLTDSPFLLPLFDKAHEGCRLTDISEHDRAYGNFVGWVWSVSGEDIDRIRSKYPSIDMSHAETALQQKAEIGYVSEKPVEGGHDKAQNCH